MSAARTVRTLEAAEVETLVGWAAAEGWNPGLADAPAFRAADPQGFIGAFVDREMVAGISAVAYGETFGFIGLYICHPRHRGGGHGKAVWDAGMAHLSGRTIGLDGVDEQVENYRRKGFAPAYRTVRFGGRVAAGAFPGDPSVQALTPAMIPAVEAFDARCFPAPRRAFLERWLAPAHRAVAILRREKVRGYGVLRRCREGYKIGPLFAADTADALGILSTLSGLAVGETVYLDVPATADGFVRHLAAAGLTPGFETTRMYRGQAPSISGEGVFAVTSLELG